MLDRLALYDAQYERVALRDLDNPHTLNGFVGEFDFSDHDLVPEPIRNLVMAERPEERFRSVPLEAVTSIARAIHGGEPGVEGRINRRLRELHLARLERVDDAPKNANYEPQLTIDDWQQDDGNKRTELDT